MEHIKQEIKVEPKEELNSWDIIDEGINETHQLKTEENKFVNTMKTEDMIKTEVDYTPKFIPALYASIVSGTEESIDTKDPIKVELARNYFKTETNKTEVLKTLVIKLERIDKKFCVDGLEVFTKDEESIVYNLPMKTSAESLDNKTDINSYEASDADNDSTELNIGVENEDSCSSSTFAKFDVKKKYVRPLKFVCIFCKKGFSTISLLKAHKRIHTGERPYRCSYCKKPFRTKTLLKVHLQLHTGKRHQCTECNMKFTQVGPLNVHMRTHSGEKPFKCSECKKTFISKPLLKKHIENRHSAQFVLKQKDNCYICAVCKRGFMQKDLLSNHIQNVHLKVTTFPCRICGMLSSSVQNRKKHERLHENKYSFVCPICNYSFKEKGGLKCHYQCVHSEKKPFSCATCNTSFKTLANLKIHIEVHHSKKNPNKFVCDVCEMGFYRLVYLKRHKQTHIDSDKIFTCDVCGTKCRSKTDMERHVVIHIGGGDKPFKCDVCAMAFSRRGKLLRHQLVHSDDKPFKCDLCSKAYKDSSSLRIHKDSFHMKRKFICDHCGWKSTNESSFKRHVRRKMCKI